MQFKKQHTLNSLNSSKKYGKIKQVECILSCSLYQV